MPDTPTQPTIPAGFNPGESPSERPDLWAFFVAVCGDDNEVVTHFSFAKSVAGGAIAAFRSGVRFIEVERPSELPPAGHLWNGSSFVHPAE